MSIRTVIAGLGKELHVVWRQSGNVIGQGSCGRKNIANADLVYPVLAIVVLYAQQSAENYAL